MFSRFFSCLWFYSSVYTIYSCSSDFTPVLVDYCPPNKLCLLTNAVIENVTTSLTEPRVCQLSVSCLHGHCSVGKSWSPVGPSIWTHNSAPQCRRPREAPVVLSPHIARRVPTKEGLGSHNAPGPPCK
ncbi:hypothetical protein OG21DRAFT_627829 [Imleria badia]|nr:hypothetical protein OG21DRAFT_627829 [Imleria badia]